MDGLTDNRTGIPMFRICTTLLAAVPLLSACVATGAKPEPFPRPGASSVTRGGAPAPGGILSTALDLRGTPYRNGGNDPSGFDCSGFVWYVFTRNGLPVPRTVGELFRDSTPVSPDALGPGDLVFFDTGGSGVSHVGIALGPDEFVHAPSSRGEVRVERISGSYWAPRFVGGRRLRSH
jgi:cell wall-associated NlpC family hydrolase